MSARESLSHYQMGGYLFTRATDDEAPWVDEYDAAPAASGSSVYGMYREPTKEEAHGGEGWAPAMDVGQMEIWHHPPAIPLQERRWVGNAAARAERRANPPSYGGEGTGRVVHSQSWHAMHSPSDELAEIHVAKGSRVMTSTLMGMAENAARERTGQSLKPGTSLSPHSQRLVEQLRSAGMVDKNFNYTANNLTFRDPIPVGPRGGLEGLFSDIQHGVDEGWEGTPHPVPALEAERGRQTGREIVRRMRPGRTVPPAAPFPGRSRAEQSGHVPRSVRDA